MLKIFPHFRPDLLDWRQVERRDVRERIDLAFHIMDREYGVTRLLDPEGESSSIHITTIYIAFLWDETLQHSRNLSHKVISCQLQATYHILSTHPVLFIPNSTHLTFWQIGGQFLQQAAWWLFAISIFGPRVETDGWGLAWWWLGLADTEAREGPGRSPRFPLPLANTLLSSC